MTVTLTDYDLAGLFPGVEDEPLLVVLSPDMFDVVDLSPRSAPTEVMTWTGPGSRANLVEKLRGNPPATALWVTTDQFQPFAPEELGDGRIGAISFYSTPPSSDRLRTIVALVGTTDYRRQVAIERRFLELLDGSEFLSLSDDRFGAVAILDHQECQHWCSQNGPLDHGMQTLLPTGELTTLAGVTGVTGELGDDDCFPLEGRLVLHGEPLTYRGDSRISWDDTRVAYESMSALWDHPVVAEVSKGRIIDVAPAPGYDATAVEVLTRLFDADDRYRKIHELGFGTNERCRPMRRGNFFPDQRYPGVHVGLGLGGHSSFQFEIVCPLTTVKAHFGDREVELYEAAGLRGETLSARPSARV